MRLSLFRPYLTADGAFVDGIPIAEARAANPHIAIPDAVFSEREWAEFDAAVDSWPYHMQLPVLHSDAPLQRISKDFYLAARTIALARNGESNYQYIERIRIASRDVGSCVEKLLLEKLQRISLRIHAPYDVNAMVAKLLDRGFGGQFTLYIPKRLNPAEYEQHPRIVRVVRVDSESMFLVQAQGIRLLEYHKPTLIQIPSDGLCINLQIVASLEVEALDSAGICECTGKELLGFYRDYTLESKEMSIPREPATIMLEPDQPHIMEGK